MTEHKVTVNTQMEARPAALFVQTASKFASSISVKIGEKNVNAKSIMGMMYIGIKDGLEVTIAADGVDEQEAVNELVSFLSRR